MAKRYKQFIVMKPPAAMLTSEIVQLHSLFVLQGLWAWKISMVKIKSGKDVLELKMDTCYVHVLLHDYTILL